MQPRDLSGHAVYRAGRGVEEVARELGMEPDDLVKLSSNENALGPSPKAVEAIREAAAGVHTYPKAVHADLVAALARQWGVAPEQVWLANGGDGALDYLARATLDPGDAVLVPEPGFAYYAMSARYHHGSVETYRLSKGAGFAQTAEGVLEAYDGERIVYLTSPHNPTGSEMGLDAIATIAAETDPETLVVVDEAYAEYADAPSALALVDGRAEGHATDDYGGTRTSGPGDATDARGRSDGADVSRREDVAVLRTFSKAHGLAGVRLGYALVPEPWADTYARVNTPFAASTLACRAGLGALRDDEHVARSVETARWAREHIRAELDAPTYASAGNFVLADVGDGAAVAETARRDGVIVRDCTSFGLPECIRITCGTREETERAVAVLNGVLAG
jgi:histidinol-phosphate aminotransferase